VTTVLAFFSITYPFPIGEKAPNFENLQGVDGKKYSLSSFDDKRIIALVFIANRCPTARVYTDRLKTIQNDYAQKGVQLIGVNSDNQYFFSLESLNNMIEVAEERHFNFPYLKDEDQSLAKKYGALVTLHAFVLDKERRLRYRGRIDDSRNPTSVTTNDLRNALDDLLESRTVKVPETRPFACAIEYV
jgi:peroxiredoxin